jgi:hypothetical protein
MKVRVLAMAALIAGMISMSSSAQDAENPKGALKGLFGDPEKTFEKMDANGDKKVTKEEFKKFFDNLAQGKLGDKIGDKLGQFTDAIFSRIDADKNDEISLEELKKMRDGLDKEKLKELREKLKQKKDGGE